MPLAVVLMKDLPSDHAEIVAELFDSYGMKLDGVYVPGENLGLDGLSMAAFSDRINGLEEHSRGVVFVLRSKAKNEQLEETYLRIKASCEAAKWQVAAVSVENLSASPQISRITEKIAKAFQGLSSQAETSPSSVKASAEVSQPEFSCVAVYVMALPEQDQADGKCVAELGNTSNIRKQDVSRNFVVTLAVVNPKTGAFETRSFFQTCNASAYATASNPHSAGGKSVYPGIHCVEPEDAKEIKGFLQSSMSGPEMTRLIVFRAGVLPSQHGSTPSSLDSEISFFSIFADEKGYNMAYYSTSSLSGARLTPPSRVSELTHSALVVKSDYANSHKWLIQKETPTGSPAGPIILTLHRGEKEKADKDFFGPDSAVFSALWSFPPYIQSTKELAPVAVARKMTRRLVKELTAHSEEVLVERLRVVQEELSARSV